MRTVILTFVWWAASPPQCPARCALAVEMYFKGAWGVGRIMPRCLMEGSFYLDIRLRKSYLGP